MVIILKIQNKTGYEIGSLGGGRRETIAGMSGRMVRGPRWAQKRLNLKGEEEA